MRACVYMYMCVRVCVCVCVCVCVHAVQEANRAGASQVLN